jgi:outer membrane murein-binding lipoprotein Lpp
MIVGFPVRSRAEAIAPQHTIRVSGCAGNRKRNRMSERLETLKKARERMTDDRDAFAKVLAAPFDRDKAERARVKFIETQVLIDAIDRAIDGEQGRPAAAA